MWLVDRVKLIRKWAKKKEIARNEIENILKNLNSLENLDDFRKLSLLYFLVTFLIPNKEQTINIEYVYMVYDIREFNNLAWGKIVYDELLKGLKICSKKFKSYKKHTQLNGCAYALQVWALERIPILAPHSLQSRILRYHRYSAFLPLKREMYECALKSVDATVEIKVSPDESRISVIRKALNAKGLEKNTTDFLMKRIRSLEKELKRVRSLEEEFRFLKKGYAELKETGEFSRQRIEREENNAKVDNDVINLASDAAKVPIDYSTTPIVDEFRNDNTRSANMDLLKSFECIGKRVSKKSSWLRTPYQAYDN